MSITTPFCLQLDKSLPLRAKSLGLCARTVMIRQGERLPL